jgi:hypothetical protein
METALLIGSLAAALYAAKLAGDAREHANAALSLIRALYERAENGATCRLPSVSETRDAIRILERTGPRFHELGERLKAIEALLQEQKRHHPG